jgi:hypothetical protein
MAKQVYIVEQHKDRSGWAIIFLAALIIACWKWISLFIVFAAILWMGYLVYQKYSEHKAWKASNNAAIAARADRQFKLALAGDPLGIEGDYPAYTMPLTNAIPFLPDYNFDDYNDGLKEWN